MIPETIPAATMVGRRSRAATAAMGACATDTVGDRFRRASSEILAPVSRPAMLRNELSRASRRRPRSRSTVSARSSVVARAAASARWLSSSVICRPIASDSTSSPAIRRDICSTAGFRTSRTVSNRVRALVAMEDRSVAIRASRSRSGGQSAEYCSDTRRRSSVRRVSSFRASSFGARFVVSDAATTRCG